MITEDKVIELFASLQRQFNNLAIQSVGPWTDESGRDGYKVTLDSNNDPEIIKTLPATFDDDPVHYSVTPGGVEFYKKTEPQ